jgi:flagellar motor protein MotB
MYKILIFFSLVILLSGCVPKSKYTALKNRIDALQSEHYLQTSQLAEAKRQLRRIEENSGLEQLQKIAAQDSSAAALSEKMAVISNLQVQFSQQEQQCQNRIAAATKAASANKEAEQKAKNLARQKVMISQLQNNVFATTDSSLWDITADGQHVRISLIEATFFKPTSRVLENTGKPLLTQLAKFLLENPDVYITLLSYAPESVPFLAQVRSHNIYSFLLSLKIPSSRIQELWREKPANSPLNSTEIILSLSPLL